MQGRMTRWTGGEISAMVAPMFEISPEDVHHVAVIVGTKDGIQVIGCPHDIALVEMVHRETGGYNPGPRYVGNSGHKTFRQWLAGILR